jgi:hypothetical protein
MMTMKTYRSLQIEVPAFSGRPLSESPAREELQAAAAAGAAKKNFFALYLAFLEFLRAALEREALVIVAGEGLHESSEEEIGRVLMEIGREIEGLQKTVGADDRFMETVREFVGAMERTDGPLRLTITLRGPGERRRRAEACLVMHSD